MRTRPPASLAALLVLACLACCGCAKENEVRSSGPYVQNVTSGSAVVAAQTVDLAELQGTVVAVPVVNVPG